ncbi:unnamed protein product [Diamesa tonsa]
METDRLTELENTKICRICLNSSEEDAFYFDIFESNNDCNASSLPMQILSVGAVEVYPNDGMPRKICKICKGIMSNSFKFKQICKRADTLLKMYPMTGKLPAKIQLPEELMPVKPVKNPIIEESSDVTIQIMAENDGYLLEYEDEEEQELKQVQEELKQEQEQTYMMQSQTDTPVEVVETHVFACTMCERSYPLSQLLEIHMKNHVRERNHPCDLCSKSFFSKYDLAKHNLIHTGQKDYKCIVCKKSFSRSTLLYRHEKIHTNAVKFTCSECARSYLNEDDYLKHIETHKKSRKFKCNYCDKKFAFKQGLERHEVVHAIDQPFPCEYCELRFPSASKLSRHLTQHAGTRPFPCKVCNKSFMLSHHLSRHARTSHQLPGAYQCTICNEMFEDRSNYIDHCTKHAAESLQCPLCKTSFDDIDQVMAHLTLHSENEEYSCDYCDMVYLESDELEKHFIEQHNNEICSIAGGEETIEFIVYGDHMKSGNNYSRKPKRKAEDSCENPRSKIKLMDETDLIEHQDDNEVDITEQYDIEGDGDGSDYTIETLADGIYMEYPEDVKEETPLPKVKVQSPAKPLPMKQQPTEVKISPAQKHYKVKTPVYETRKMLPSEIEKLKAQGKIMFKDGKMILKK